MRHAKHTCKLGRNGTHVRAMFANMLKSLILNGRIETTVAKAKELKRYADKMITLGKKNDLNAKRKVISELRIQYNPLTPKEKRLVKKDATKTHMYNGDRKVVNKLFDELSPRFAERNGGYTRIIRTSRREGDNAPKCLIEYV
ncbi:MAG: 50S ribosomal protein L17 [Simkaniaceae bacterium]|nr:50S ribosomal protein L17 [Simkaniaceae bacterium]